MNDEPLAYIKPFMKGQDVDDLEFEDDKTILDLEDQFNELMNENIGEE